MANEITIINDHGHILAKDGETPQVISGITLACCLWGVFYLNWISVLSSLQKIPTH